MNIFYLDNNPKICAQYHVDKHCVKMILETAQLLSTAHRIIDGTKSVIMSGSGRRKQVWALPDAEMNEILYSATHVNHPSAVWVRKSGLNYAWLHKLLVELCTEYTHRYGKVHKVQREYLMEALKTPPKNILWTHFTEPTPAMPDQYKVPGDAITSYRNYYNGEKQRMFSWKKREIPEWINHGSSSKTT